MIADMILQPHSHPYLLRETHLIALTRAVHTLPLAALDDKLARARAYAAAGVQAWSDADDAEALRRETVYGRRLTASRGAPASADLRAQPERVAA